MNSSALHTSHNSAIEIGEAAKLFDIGRNTLFRELRNAGILQADNVPYKRYMKYFTVIELPVSIRHQCEIRPVTHINQQGIEYISKRLGLCKQLTLPDFTTPGGIQ